jgi:FMN reductase
MSSFSALGISASPSPNSRSQILVARTLEHLGQLEVEHQLLELNALPAEGLLARTRDPHINDTIQRVISSKILVFGTPVYRASYASQLKAFLDLFPQDSLRGVVVGLIATGAGPAHQLTIDHTLRPLVASLRGLSASQGIYVVDSQFPDKSQLPDSIDAQTAILAQELVALAKGYASLNEGAS